MDRTYTPAQLSKLIEDLGDARVIQILPASLSLTDLLQAYCRESAGFDSQTGQKILKRCIAQYNSFVHPETSKDVILLNATPTKKLPADIGEVLEAAVS